MLPAPGAQSPTAAIWANATDMLPAPLWRPFTTTLRASHKVEFTFAPAPQHLVPRLGRHAATEWAILLAKSFGDLCRNDGADTADIIRISPPAAPPDAMKAAAPPASSMNCLPASESSPINPSRSAYSPGTHTMSASASSPVGPGSGFPPWTRRPSRSSGARRAVVPLLAVPWPARSMRSRAGRVV